MQHLLIWVVTGLAAGWLARVSVSEVHAFDPFPFILLNLVLSCLAAIQAPIIMMSQNRQAARDRVDVRSDYEVNLRAEMQIMLLHEKLDTARHDEIGLIVSELRQLREDVAALRRLAAS